MYKSKVNYRASSSQMRMSARSVTGQRALAVSNEATTTGDRNVVRAGENEGDKKNDMDGAPSASVGSPAGRQRWVLVGG